jgi:hypothetical protein
MITGQKNDSRSESGVALLMALLFITVMGLIVGATAVYAGAIGRQSFSARKIQVRETGTNGGMEWAVNTLRQGKDAFCQKSGVDRQVLPIGGREVEVLCKGNGTGSSGKNAWALYINAVGGPQNVLRTNGASVSTLKHIIGPVYNGGGWDIHADLYVDGDVQVPGSCTPPTSVANPAPGDLYPLYGTLRSCSVPLNDPSVIPTPVPAPCGAPATCTNPPYQRLDAAGAVMIPANTNSETCRVFSPGFYANAPDLAGLNFFRPGVYYFDFNQTWKIRTAVRGGDPRPGSSTVAVESIKTSIPKCVGAPAAAAPYGVVFVFGKQAALDMDNQGRLELFSYQSTPGAPSPPSIVGVSNLAGASTVTPWPSSASTLPLAKELVSVGTAQPEFVIHSGLFAPENALAFKGSNDAKQLILNSVVVARFEMQASNSITSDNFGIQVPTGAVKRYILIANSCRGSLQGKTSNACDGPVPAAPLEPELCTAAALEIYDDSERTVWLKSWRVDRQPGTTSDSAPCSIP